MLEVFLLMTLIRSIKNNVTERGRKPGGFIALAVILWVIPEIIGLCIGIYLEMGYASYLIAAVFVGIGVIISYNVAKHCKEGDYVEPQELLVRQFTEYYEPLPAEQEVLITREKAFAGSAAKYDMVLNGKIVGTIRNGDTLHARTDQRQNILVARLNGGADLPPFVFQVADGLPADIHFVSGRFLPDRSTGIVAYGKAVSVNPAYAKARYVPVIDNQAVAPVYATPFQQVYGTPVQPGMYSAPAQNGMYANPYQPAAPVYANPEQPSAASGTVPGFVPAQPAAAPSTVPGFVPAQSGTGFCEHCGSPLSAGNKFCGKCGAPVQ